MMIHNGRMESYWHKNIYYPVHILWGANNIYVRRHITIDDKEALEGRKMYVRYICDGQMNLTVMESIFHKLIINLCNWNASNYPA